MVNKKLLAMGYCFIFISIYFITLAYAAASLYLKNEHNILLPQTATLNATTNAVSSFSSWSSIPIMVIAVVIVLVIIFFFLNGARAMGEAI
jgi:hypothetical protein